MNIEDYRRRDADSHAHRIAAHLAALEPLFSSLSDAGMQALEDSLKHFAAVSAEMRELLNMEAANEPRPRP